MQSRLLDQFGNPLSKPSTTKLDPLNGLIGLLGQWIYAMPNPDEVLHKSGKDVRAYFEILRHPQLYTVVDTRLTNFRRREIVVQPAETENTAAEERADFVRDEFDRLRIDQVRGQLWWAAWLGYSAAVLDWKPDAGGYLLDAVRVYPPHLTGFDMEGRPVVWVDGQWRLPGGSRVICAQTGGIHGWDHYGGGCARPCYWPAFFAINLMKPWAEDVEKYASPKVYAMVPAEWYDENSAGKRNVANVLNALQDFVRNSHMAMPGVDEVQLETLTTSQYSTSLVYKQFHAAIDEWLTKAVLGQTLSTDGGVIGSGSEALGRVQAETGLVPRIEADCAMVAEPLTELARLITYHRYGSDELAPTVGFESGEVSIETLDYAVNKLGLPVAKGRAYELLGLEPPAEDDEVIEPKQQTGSLFGGDAAPFDLALADTAAEGAREQEDFAQTVKGDLSAAYRLLGEHYAGQTGDWRQAPEGILGQLAETLAAIVLVAYATGRGKVLESQRIAMADDIDFGWSRTAHDEARDYLLTKQVMTRAQFDALDDRVKARAFTIAKEEDKRVLAYARDRAAEVATGDITQAEYREALTDKNPWLTDHHIETVVRTNVGQAYEAGRFTELTQGVGKGMYPFYQYAALDDGRTRPSHKAMDGRIFAADDPDLGTYWGPNGFNCRCTMVPFSADEAQRRGVSASGGSPELEFDEGFDTAPGAYLGLN
jgi:SPP1 gp7 family putative phage head morphogenesis protein